MELGDMGSSCEEGDCGSASGLLENCSECQWEEPMFGHIELVCVTVLCVSLMLLGLVGNILTILVVWLCPHMRSSTYLYLSSMAVSDLLILLLLPLDLYKLWRPRPWPLGDLACKLTMFLSECCTFSTILHITFLSLERYLAVCWPITAKTLVTRHRTKVLIGCLWLGAAVSAAPVLVMVGAEVVGGMEGWRGDDGWMGADKGQDGVMLEGERTGGGEMILTEGMGGVQWTGERVTDWDEGGQIELASRGEQREGKHGGGETKHSVIQEQTGEEKVEVKPEGQKGEKEHRGGREGREEEEKMEERRRGGLIEQDMRECRCTDYAISSGLLSAMTILSNLYFLVPLSILGIVYGLIGRTLWLRPQSSVRDQTHRHTVKMLGVIVLVFVLCWLPFHAGRTLFSLSLGSAVDGSDTHVDTHTDTRGRIDTYAHTDTDDNAGTRTVDHTNADPSATSHRSGLCTRDTDNHVHANTNTQPKTRTPRHQSPSSDGRHHAHSNDDHVINVLSRTRTHAHVRDLRAQRATHTSTRVDKLRDTQTSAHSQSCTSPSTHVTNVHVVTRGDAQTHAHGADPDPQNATRAAADAHAGTREGAHDPMWPDANTTEEDLHANDTHAPRRSVAGSLTLYFLSQYLSLASSVLCYLSAAINPLLYNLMSARYRRAVSSLVRSRTGARAHHSSQMRQFTTHQSTTV